MNLIKLFFSAVIYSSVVDYSFAVAHSIISTKSTKNFIPSNAEMNDWVRKINVITEKYENFRRSGTEGDRKVRQFIVSKLESFNVDRVEEESFETESAVYKKWSLVVNDKEIPCFFMKGAPFTDNASIQGDLVYIEGSVPDKHRLADKIVLFDVKGESVSGKELLDISNYVSDPTGAIRNYSIGGDAGAIPDNFPMIYNVIANHKAKAAIGILKDYATGTMYFYPDRRATVPDRIPGLFIGKQEGEKLVNLITAASVPLKAAVSLSGESKVTNTANVVAHINGNSKEYIIINTHYDAGFKGAVQSTSGVVATLGLAKYYASIPRHLLDKNIIFVFHGAHFNTDQPVGAEWFFKTHFDILKNTVLSVGIENIAKRFTATAQGYTDTGDVEPRIMFTPPNSLLFDITRKAIEKNQLHSTFIPKSGFMQMYGDSLSFYRYGIPSYALTSQPEYLYLEDDTIDKIATDEFEPVVGTFATIIDQVMALPSEWIRIIDNLTSSYKVN